MIVNRALFVRASVAAAVVFVLVCIRALVGPAQFASKKFGVFAAMLFAVCAVSPFAVAFLGRRGQTEWPWSWVFAATAVTTAVLGFGLYEVMKFLH